MSPIDAAGSGADRFHRGRVVQVRPGARTGVVRSANGRDIPFSAATLRILGTERGFEALAEGQTVGYDVGRSSEGLRVTTIRLYESGAKA